MTSQIRKEAKQETVRSIKESNNPSEFWKAAKKETSSGENQELDLVEKRCRKCFEISNSEEPYCCSTCGKKIFRADALKTHTREHSKEQSFSCTTCSVTFTMECELKIHERDHTGEKPIVCSHCGGTFCDTKELQKHERVHTGESAFMCSTCNEEFDGAEALKRHENDHIGDNPFTCATCDKKFHSKDEHKVPIESEKGLAETFNNFFPSKVEKIEQNIPVQDIDPTSKLREKLKGRELNFTFPSVTETTVRKAIKSIKSKSSSGLDYISSKVLKMAEDVIAAPLTFIINNSLKSGVFPKSWKSAKVIPLYKNKGSRSDKTKYRPVSLLKATSKVIRVHCKQVGAQVFRSE